MPPKPITPKGLSLHIGLNGVDPIHYGGWDGTLAACEFDANDMSALAKAQGFPRPLTLRTKMATSNVVIRAIEYAAAKLKSGDIFFLSYSGHGGQVPDTNGDDEDGQDETWVLYDRELVDDELYALWSKFAAGVRIVVLSDSCHSGTVTRAMPVFRVASAGIARPKARLMPPDIALRTYQRNKELYDGIQKEHRSGEKVKVQASVLLISGCQDNQLSSDGSRNGLFTEKLRAVWDGGKFSGTYKYFRDKIASLMPDTQSPNFYKAGVPNLPFETETPFTIGGKKATENKPSKSTPKSRALFGDGGGNEVFGWYDGGGIFGGGGGGGTFGG